MEVIDKLVNKNLQFNRFLSFLKKQEERENWPLITISREKGAGGRIAAQILAKKLGGKWDYYHRDIVEEIAKAVRIDKAKVVEVDEKEVPYLEEVVGVLTGKEYLSLSKYHRALIGVLTQLANKGSAILVGRGANFLFPNSLKIRIIADPEQRVKWLVKYEKLSEKEAKSLIKKSDKERRNFVLNLFGKDVNDMKYYDVVLKTSDSFTAKDAAEVIAKIAKIRFALN